MKKKYTAPEATSIKIEAQQMMAASLPATGNKETDNVFSGKRGWDSDDWSGSTEEE